MKKKLFSTNSAPHVHFLGVAGIGMRGLAEILLNQGYKVSGCDQQDNPATERLRQLGAHILLGHEPAHLQAQVDALIYSSALPDDHPELVAAQQAGIPTLRRGELLGELMQTASQRIAIAGTHGKTTTTGLISHLLIEAGLNPTCVNGGILNGQSSTVHVGSQECFVAEADESDASLLALEPTIAVVTNIEADHLGTYANNFAQLTQTFVDFLNKLPDDGLAICCGDDPTLQKLVPQINAPLICYGFASHNDLIIESYQQRGTESVFRWRWQGETQSQHTTVNLPGKHNVANAAAAIAVAHTLQISIPQLTKALASFPGVGRRFHYQGELSLGKGSASVYDDYGHHPTEVRATLQAARQAWPQRRLVLAFQPHRYSRTAALLPEFIDALSQADVLLLLSIYSAGEQPIPNVTSYHLCQQISKQGAQPHYVATLQELPLHLHEVLKDGDVLFLQGAGSIGQVSAQLNLKVD